MGVKTKRNADGEIEHYNVRLVAQGFSPKFGSDCGDILSCC